ncbi:testis-expressed protein 36-like [Saccostrea echinata]|uniref:testis-expressed protein 36-like n=1 Tax=Saccostrea echinata TaxID=191078 RepID=UPI002A8367BF|nr:testis-expressed protein 36-like [Saccostrea echinata]
MARGRQFAPSPASDGKWFVHRGSESAYGERKCLTSTGIMLAAPFGQEAETKPAPPPPPFRSKTEINYKTANKFSEHNNRHAFQDHGVYFGNGKDERTLGRKITLPELRLHHTEKTFLKHHSRNPVDADLNTNYRVSYLGQPTENPPAHRRFARKYRAPETGSIKLQTSTTDWHKSPDVPYRTPTHVLAVSQEPFPKHNPWKYSNHGMRDIYPPYERSTKPLVNNQFNKYGAAFAAASE